MVTLVVGPPHKEESIILSKSNPNLIDKMNLERIHVRESGFFVIAEVLDLGITVRWDKNTRVYVEAHPKWSSKVGLNLFTIKNCYNCNRCNLQNFLFFL